MRKFPIIRPSAGCPDILKSVLRDRGADYQAFNASLALATGNRSIFLTNSGLAAFFLVLTALKKKSVRREVVLPAYTAGSLIVAVKKAGLKPVLCDISLDDFNLDRRRLPGTLSEKTLAVVAVHMFGLPINDLDGIRKCFPPGVWLVEDCCQAQGAKVNGLEVGASGDIGFFSFNRGKNFSTFGGGCVATNDQDWAREIDELYKVLASPGPGSESFLWLKMLASILATSPWVYGCAYPLLRRFKENAPPDDFLIERLSGLQGSLGAIISRERNSFFARRNRNGRYLADGLRGAPGIRLAELSPECYPVYNRFPILFEDRELCQKKLKELWRAGFEASRMYLQPLHVMFELGYKPQEFPNACYFAQRLLTLPVYPGLREKELDRIVEVIKK